MQWKNLKPNRTLLLCAISGLCWLAQGMGQANFGNSTNLEVFIKHFETLNSKAPGISAGEKSHRSLMVGLVTAVYELGLGGGGLSTYFFGDKLGRRGSTLLAASVVIIGVAIESSSFSLAQLIVGRIVAGLGIGAFTATVPTWITETALPQHRGAFVMLGGGFAITGVAAMSWMCLGMFIHKKTHELTWRLPLGIQGIVAVLVICGVFFLDESPRALIRLNKRDEAYRVLNKNRRGLEQEAIDEEFTEILQAYENEVSSHDKSPWSNNEHKQLRRTVTAIILSGMCQMSGINLITFYGSIIFEQEIGLSATKSRISLAGLQTWQAICAFSASFFVSWLGRRNILLIASACMCISFCCCAGLKSAGTEDTSYGILAFDAVQLAVFPIGLLINPFLIGSEISGLLCRSAVMACVSAINWTMNFVLALVTPLGFSNIGYQYYIVYVATNAALFIFSFLFVPDTSGLALEEIDQAYVNSKSWFDIVKCCKAIRAAGHVPPEPLRRRESKEFDKGYVEMIEDVEKQ